MPGGIRRGSVDDREQENPAPVRTPFATNLLSSAPLSGGPAVGALIVTEAGEYLLQHRDDRPDIYFPGHWGLFGGAVNPAEGAETAMRRELEEELGFRTTAIRYFTRFTTDLSGLGQPDIDRLVFELRVPQDAISGFRLAEGKAMRLFRAADLLENCRVVPYDAFAIWLHASQARFSGRA